MSFPSARPFDMSTGGRERQSVQRPKTSIAERPSDVPRGHGAADWGRDAVPALSTRRKPLTAD
jgi:hypothetical protein